MLTVSRDLGLKEPYVGSVELVSGEIAEDLAQYMVESEQIPSAVGLGVLIDTDRSVKAAGGFIVQLMPGAPEKLIDTLEANIMFMDQLTTVLSEDGVDAVVSQVLFSLDPREAMRAAHRIPLLLLARPRGRRPQGRRQGGAARHGGGGQKRRDNLPVLRQGVRVYAGRAQEDGGRARGNGINRNFLPPAASNRQGGISMKKRRVITICAIALFALGAAAWAAFAGRASRPFERLEAEDIALADVTVMPPDITARVDDTERLAGLLRACAVYGEDASYDEYARPGRGFRTHAQGRAGSERHSLQPVPHNRRHSLPLRIRRLQCARRLRQFRARIRARRVLDSPTWLCAVSGNTSAAAVLGGYEWDRPRPDGSSEHVIADAAVPLAAAEHCAVIDTYSDSAELQFGAWPDRLGSVRRIDPETGEGSAVEQTGGHFSLAPGMNVYAVSAEWTSTIGTGSAEYFFKINRLE